MSNPVRGDNNNFRPDEFKKEDKIDNPEEFNDLMKKKVDESDETEKQKKRPQAAPQEDDEDDAPAPEDQENPTAGAFASFMTEEEQGPQQEYQSFAPQSTQESENVSQEDFEDVDTSNIDENATEIVRQDEPAPVEEQPAQQFQPVENQGQPQETQAPAQSQQTEQAQQTNAPKKTEKTTKTAPKKATKKTGKGEKHEGEEPNLDTKKTESEKTKQVEETKSDQAGKTPDDQVVADATLNNPNAKIEKEEGKKGKEEEKVDALDKSKKAKGAKGAKKAEETLEAGPKKKTKEEEKTEKTDFGMQTGEVTQTVKGSLPSASVTKLGPVASLKPEILHILQKAVLTIRVMKELGHEKTSVELHMPGSVLNGAKINIAKYAEGTFNVQLTGDPEAVNLFEANREGLEKALKDRGLDVTLESSRLREEKKAKTVTRKEQTG